MTSSTERKNKGKVLAQGYPQDKRLPAGQPFVMHEGASSGKKSSRSTSLQEFVPTEVTYSNGDMVVDLQEVLSRILQFHNGVYSELPNSIKFILDNLQAAFTLKHHTLFEKPSKHLKSILLTLLHKMRLIQATMLTKFQKIRLLEAILLTTQILQMNPTLVNSLAKRKSIQWIKRL